MNLIKNGFLFLGFILIIFGIFVADVNANSKMVRAASDDLPSAIWEVSDDLSLTSSDSSEKVTLVSSKINVVVSSGVKYDSKKKKWIAFHKINQMIGKPSSVKTTLKILKKPSKGSKATTYHTRSHTFKGISLRSGAKYEYEIPKSTGFYKKEFITTMTSGGKKASKVVPDSKYVLFNKKLSKFPDFTDKWSKKVASDIRTDWPKGQKYKRVATVKMQVEYEKEYKVKPKWKQDEIHLHHIRPVAYGGNSKIENYLAIPADKHTKITSWFTNY